MNDREKIIREALGKKEQKADTHTMLAEGGASHINYFPTVTTVNIHYSMGTGEAQYKHTLLTAKMREQLYRKCHALARQYGLYPAMREHMNLMYGKASMRDLTDSALNALHHYLRSLEVEHKR